MFLAFAAPIFYTFRRSCPVLYIVIGVYSHHAIANIGVTLAFFDNILVVLLIDSVENTDKKMSIKKQNR